MSYVGVMAYLLEYVRGAGGSTLSVTNALSNLRSYCKKNSIRWLSSADIYLVGRAVKLLQLNDTTPSKRSEAITMDLITQLIELMDLTQEEQLMQATLFLLAHDGCFRLDELFRNLRVSDFRWTNSRRTVFLNMVRTKTHRRGDPIEAELVGLDDSKMCAVVFLRRWFDKMQLWGKSALLVFPQFTHYGGKTRVNHSRNYSRGMFVRGLRSTLQRLGLNRMRFSGHGFRAGGATDLFAARVPLPTVMKHGRWRTAEACLRYYREGAEVAIAVALAFLGR